MKKFLALMLALMMALSLVACGEKAPAADDGAAAPDDGYRFVEWRAGTEVVARIPSFTTSAQSDRTYTAVFEEAATETVTITLKGSGGYYYED